MSTQQIEMAKTVELMSVYANQLAAVIDSMIQSGHVAPQDLELVRDSLGEIHVELDQAAEDLWQAREPVSVRLVRAAA